MSITLLGEAGEAPRDPRMPETWTFSEQATELEQEL